MIRYSIKCSDPISHTRSGAPVYKGMTTIEHQVAHVHNVCMFKMNNSISICMTVSIIIKANFFLTDLFTPGFSKSFIRIQLLVFDLLLNGYISLVLQRIFVGQYIFNNSFERNITGRMILVMMSIDEKFKWLVTSFF